MLIMERKILIVDDEADIREILQFNLENAGFIFQQVDLYIQSLGLGSCWVGLGRPKGAAVKNKENKWGFVNSKNEQVIPFEYDRISRRVCHQYNSANCFWEVFFDYFQN